MAHSLAMTDTSPRRDLMALPRANRWSPRSTSDLKAASDSSPTVREAQHDLEAVALAVLDGREAQLAGVADEHDPPGDADDVLGLLAVVESGVRGADLGDLVRLGTDTG